jgi:predicted PurR-regulated permease PerM
MQISRMLRQQGGAARPARPLLRGFLFGLGAIGAGAFAVAAFSLRGVVASVLTALFIAIALEPVIARLRKRGMGRPAATAVIAGLLVAVLSAVVVFGLPALQAQAFRLIESLPAQIAALPEQEWFLTLDELTGGSFTAALGWFAATLADPQTWLAVSGGLLGFGASVVNGVSAGFFILVLTLYFIATFESIKGFFYSLIAASRRRGFTDVSDRIIDSVGRYLGGMVVLAFMNATYSTVLLLIIGVDAALLIGVAAFFITIIPLIGTVLTTIGITLITLITVPSATIPVLIFMLIYMQLEAYVFTPKVMSKAVQVPGSVVLISAMAGASLLGLPGALIGVPVAASIALILREVVVPRRQRV